VPSQLREAGYGPSSGLPYCVERLVAADAGSMKHIARVLASTSVIIRINASLVAEPRGLCREVRGRINECAWTDATGAFHVETYTRRDAPRMRSSVATRCTVAVPSSAPTAPARAGQDRAIGRLLDVSPATQ
jgi:hypothetical protein